MTENVGFATLQVIPSARGFGNALNRGVGPDVQRSAKKQGDAFGHTFAKTSIGPIRALGAIALGAFAAVKTVDIFKGFVADARESAKVAALTNQVLKSTGQVAGVTARDISDLATSLSKKTGIDDEAIQSSENLLATFTNVRNQVGKGNKIFTQATGLVQDMSVALGQDASGSAIQLGKALNDPIKGITALRRVGVDFNAQQLKQVKTLVDTGKGLKAQKIIIREVGREFGGAAKAAATPTQKLSVTLGNLRESIGGSLLPTIDKVAGGLNRFVTQMQNGQGAGGKFRDVMSRVGGALKSAFVAIQPTLSKVAGFITGTLFPALKSAFTGALPTIKSFARFITGELIPALQNGFADFLPKVEGAFKSIRGTIQSNQGVFKALGEMFKIVGHVLVAIVIPSFFKLQGVYVSAIAPAFKALVFLLKTIVIPVFVFLARAWLKTIDVLVSGAAHAFGWVPGIGKKLKAANRSFDGFAAGVNESLDSITRDLTVNIHVKTVTSDLGGSAGESPQQAAALNRQAGINAAAAARKKATKTAAGDIGKNFGLDMASGISASAPKVAKAAKDTVSKAVEAAKAALKDAKQEMADFAKSVRDSILSFGDLTSLNSATGAAATPASLQRFLDKQLATITAFRKNLQTLAKRHISDSLLKKIADAGIETGGPVAAALVAANKAQFAGIESSDSKISNRAKQIGAFTSQRLFGDNVEQARIGVVNVTVNNPKEERASTSAPKAVRRALLAAS